MNSLTPILILRGIARDGVWRPTARESCRRSWRDRLRTLPRGTRCQHEHARGEDHRAQEQRQHERSDSYQEDETCQHGANRPYLRRACHHPEELPLPVSESSKRPYRRLSIGSARATDTPLRVDEPDTGTGQGAVQRRGSCSVSSRVRLTAWDLRAVAALGWLAILAVPSVGRTERVAKHRSLTRSRLPPRERQC
jgi:hypothetical protein